MDKKIILILIILAISIGTVSASDNNTSELIEDADIVLASENENVLTDNDVGTFTELQNKIGLNGEYRTVSLTKNYTFNPDTDDEYKNGVKISNTKGIVIEGNGHTIDGAGLARIFHIYTPGVIINNLRFVNAYADNGGAIYSETMVYDLTVKNSIFINNHASQGGAIWLRFNNWDVPNFQILNSTFIKNRASYGGAIYADCSRNVNLDYLIFENNTGYYGSAAWLRTPKTLSITNSKFNDGGLAVYLNSGTESNPAELTLKNNVFSQNDYLYLSGKTTLNSVKIIVLDNKTVTTDEFNNLYAIITDVEGNRLSLNGEGYGNLSFRVGSKNIVATQGSDGIWMAQYPISDDGTYVVSASHNDFKTQVLTGTVIITHKIPKKDVELSVSLTDEIESGGDVIVNVSFNHDLTGKITVSIGEDKQIFDLDGGKNNIAAQFSGLNEGSHNINITFSGNDYYFEKNISKQVNVKAKEASDTPIQNGSDNNSDINNSSVGNGTELNNSDLNNSSVGNGTELNNSDLNNSNIILVKNFSVVSADLNTFYNSGDYYIIRILLNNKPVANEKVTFIFNGKRNVISTDKNGYAKLKITSIKPRIYTVTAEYAGISITNKITVKSVITAKKTIKVKKSAKSFKVKITLKGKSVLKKQRVKVKFRGKTYSLKTNLKGVATFKVAKKVIKKLKKGKTYSYTISYNKDTVKRYVKIIR